MHTPLRAAFALLCVCTSCHRPDAQPTPTTPTPTTPTAPAVPVVVTTDAGLAGTPNTPSSADPRNVPIACATDADCPHLACGPCTSGEVVSRFVVSINCFRNPCPGTVAVCRGGVCVVR